MSVFNIGDTVFVEATVLAHTPGNPYGVVHVKVTGSTDPDGLLDGVEAIIPEPLVATSDETVFIPPTSGERDNWSDPDGEWDLGPYYEGFTPWEAP